MRIKCKISARLLFYLALDINILYGVLHASTLDYSLGGVLKYGTALITVTLLLLKWIVFERFSIRKLNNWVFFLLLALLPLIHGYTSPLLLFMLVLSADGISSDKILSRVQIGIVVWSLFVIFLCSIGIIRDYVFIHYQSNDITTVHSYGFKYYSTIGYYVMTELIIYIVKKDKDCSWTELLLIALLNLALYRIHTTLLALGTVFIYEIIYILDYKLQLIRYKRERSFWKVFSVLIPWVLCGVTVFIVMAYRKTGLSQLTSIYNGNQLLNRLRYSSRAIDIYGINLLGNKVIMYGQTAYVYGGASSAFYIDSAYMYSLIAYGIIFTIGILYTYSTILIHVLFEEESKVYYYLITILIVCVVNNFLLSITANSMILIYGRSISKKKSAQLLRC